MVLEINWLELEVHREKKILGSLWMCNNKIRPLVLIQKVRISLHSSKYMAKVLHRISTKHKSPDMYTGRVSMETL